MGSIPRTCLFAMLVLLMPPAGNRAAAETTQMSLAPRQEPTRILFIGNSFSVYNSMPLLLKTLLESADPSRRVVVGAVIEASCSLETHWNTYGTQGWLDSSAAALRPKSVLKTGPADAESWEDFQEVAWEDRGAMRWEYVVLQSWDDDDKEGASSRFAEYSRRFAEPIRRHGARVVLFGHPRDMNAGPVSDPLPIGLPDETARFYHVLAGELDAIVVPAFYVQVLCRQRNPGLGLRWVNNFHPNQECMYLVACTFYAVLTNESPQGAVLRKVVYRPNLEVDYDGRPSCRILSDELATFLQTCAWDGVSAFQETVNGGDVSKREHEDEGHTP